jgi:acetyl-CoA carboxylase biotin carboxyl carrier protein
MEPIEQMDLASIIAQFEQSSLGELEVSCSRFSVKMKGRDCCTADDAPVMQPKPERREAVTSEGDTEIIASPIVGTFYLTPAPDAPPYVHEGSKVAKGDVICTIEAMKLMNQLQAEYACEIVSVLAKPETMVEFGQPLFAVRRL